MRQLVRGYSVTHPRGTVRLPTAVGWHQVLYASSGVMTVSSPDATWVVPADRAVLLPSGLQPEVVMHGRVQVRSVYLPAALDLVRPEHRVIAVPPLLRELVLNAVAAAPLDLAVPRSARLVAVLADELDAQPSAPLALPSPRDPRAARVAAALVASPGSSASFAVLARQAGASRRTVERLFAAETGLTLAAWQRRLRLVTALELLAEGRPVTAVAAAVGYATPSAFTAMFRAELGVPPTRR